MGKYLFTELTLAKVSTLSNSVVYRLTRTRLISDLEKEISITKHIENSGILLNERIEIMLKILCESPH